MTKQLSQTALYGELLTNEGQYRKEVRSLAVESAEQRQALIEQARTGKKDAQYALVETMLSSMLMLATRYARIAQHTDVGDFCQIASLAMLEHVEQALEKESPCGYLYGIARRAMIMQCSLRDTLINKLTCDHEKEDYRVESLDVPFKEDKDQTWEDILEAPPLQCPNATNEEQTYQSLYQAFSSLNEKQRSLLFHYYGIGDYPQLTPTEIQQHLQLKGAFYHLGEVKKTLRKQLDPVYAKETAPRPRRPASQQKISCRYRWPSEQERQQLDTICEGLQSHGKKIVLRTVCNELKMNKNTVMLYLRERKQQSA